MLLRDMQTPGELQAAATGSFQRMMHHAGDQVPRSLTGGRRTVVVGVELLLAAADGGGLCGRQYADAGEAVAGGGDRPCIMGHCSSLSKAYPAEHHQAVRQPRGRCMTVDQGSLSGACGLQSCQAAMQPQRCHPVTLQGSVSGRPSHPLGLMRLARSPPSVSLSRPQQAMRASRLNLQACSVACQLRCRSQSRDPAGVGCLTTLALGVAAVEGVGGCEGASGAGTDAKGALRVLVTRVWAEGVACNKQQQVHDGSTNMTWHLCWQCAPSQHAQA